MAIPSESDFQSYLSIAKWVPKAEWLEKTIKIDPTFECIRAFLREIQDATDRHREVVYAHNVAKWFDNQPSVIRALSALSARKKLAKKLSREEYLNSRAQRFIDNSIESDFWRFSLQRTVECDPVLLTGGITNAFYNYFYTDRWLQTVKMGRNAEETFIRAHEAFNTLEDIHTRMEIMAEFYVGRGYKALSLGGSTVAKRAQAGQVLKKENFVFPAIREDKTVKERVLIFDLYRLFRRIYRSPKQTAIFHLLMTDGVGHPLDQRTVERMIEQWRKKEQNCRHRMKSLDR